MQTSIIQIKTLFVYHKLFGGFFENFDVCKKCKKRDLYLKKKSVYCHKMYTAVQNTSASVRKCGRSSSVFKNSKIQNFDMCKIYNHKIKVSMLNESFCMHYTSEDTKIYLTSASKYSSIMDVFARLRCRYS